MSAQLPACPDCGSTKYTRMGVFETADFECIDCGHTWRAGTEPA